MINEERLLSASYRSGKMKLEKPSKELLSKLSLAGENTFKKDRRINRLSSYDLMGIRSKAALHVTESR